jgi:hypothetical protein
MIEYEYLDLNGDRQNFDLDQVIEVVRGNSQKRIGWISLIVFEPTSGVFIELRDSPPDPRGNSKDEAEQVDEDYLTSSFSIDNKSLHNIRSNPTGWSFIERKD